MTQQQQPDTRAQWVIDLMHGVHLERIGHELRQTAIARRCSYPILANETDNPVTALKCTKDIGHSDAHECNVARDIGDDV